MSKVNKVKKTENEIKRCRFCGEPLVEDDKGNLICYEHNVLLRVPNDKFGAFTFFSNLLFDKTKGKVLNEAYRITSTYFITKLLSFVLIASVVVGATTSTIGIVNNTKNKELLETGKVPEKAAVLKTYDVNVSVYENDSNQQEESQIVDEQKMQTEPVEIIDNTIDDEIKSDNIVNQKETEEESIPDYNSLRLHDYGSIYFDYIKDGNPRDLFINEPITDGPCYNYVKNTSEEDFSISTLWNDDNYLYVYYWSGDNPKGDEEVFAKLTFEKVGDRYYLVSDEPVSGTFNDFLY